MLFASLIPTRKTVLENPEQARDIHKPSDTRHWKDEMKFTCRKPGESVLGAGETYRCVYD